MSSFNQKVEDLLQEKQKGKEFKDAGERVSGSRKELAAYKTITLQNLSEVERKGEAYKLVDKNRVFPPFDWKQQRDNGVSAGAAWFKNKIRSAMSAKPIDLPEGRKYYVEFCEKFQKALNEALTIGDVATILVTFKEFVNGYVKVETENTLARYGNRIRQISIIDDVFGKRFWNIVKSFGNSYWKTRNEANLKDAFTTEEQKAAGQNSERATQSTASSVEFYKRAVEIVSKAKSLDEITSNGLKLRGMERGDSYGGSSHTFVYYNGENELTQELIDLNFEFYQENIKNFQKRIDNWKPLEEYKIRNADWSWAKIKGDVKKKPDNRSAIGSTTKPTEMPIHYRSLITKIVRIGGREVVDVTVANIQDKFCYKSVLFGNYVKDTEAAHHVESFIGSMYDLEEALGADICGLNKLGGLSIAFGGYGRGKALATYHSDKRLINLTKNNGDGSVAHEWGHYLDNVLANKSAGDNNLVTVNGSRGLFATESGALSSDIQRAIKAIMNYIKNGSESVIYVTHKQTGRFKAYSKPTETVTVQGMVNRLRSNYVSYNRLENAKRANHKSWFDSIASAAKLSEITVSYVTNSTQFYSASSAMTSSYWSKDVELFARSWECYIEDKLKIKGIKSNYLVNIPKRGIEMGIYPSGEERKQLFLLFGKLIEAIKYEYGIGKEVSYFGERTRMVEDLAVSTLNKEESELKEDNFKTALQMSTDELENHYRQKASDKEKSRMKYIIPKYINEFKVIPYFSAKHLMLMTAKEAIEKWTKEWEAINDKGVVKKEAIEIKETIDVAEISQNESIKSEQTDLEFSKAFLKWVKYDTEGKRMIAKARELEKGDKGAFKKSDVLKDYHTISKRYIRRYYSEVAKETELRFLAVFDLFYLLMVNAIRTEKDSSYLSLVIEVDNYKPFFEVFQNSDGFVLSKKYGKGESQNLVSIQYFRKKKEFIMVRKIPFFSETIHLTEQNEVNRQFDLLIEKAKKLYSEGMKNDSNAKFEQMRLYVKMLKDWFKNNQSGKSEKKEIKALFEHKTQVEDIKIGMEVLVSSAKGDLDFGHKTNYRIGVIKNKIGTKIPRFVIENGSHEGHYVAQELTLFESV